ncbi:MAG TPA: PPC domain-containing DNA-binding protein, partial [Candidatus Sulfotelmatobacter sp.]|nr:PPC domain-containing DNA-binding protein [Candidatus Sulfotelmatobacter sp.]
DIIQSLRQFATTKKIGASLLEGIGSLNKVKLGHYDFKTRKYSYETFEDDLEILSLSGNIASMNGAALPHVHVTLGRRDFSVIGGHMDEGSSANMVEIGIWKLPGKLVKAKDDSIGLNVLQLARRI